MDMDIFPLKRIPCTVATILTFTSFLCASGSSNLPSGHLKPFGCCNPAKGGVTTVEGWPHPITFFKDHVIPRKPILFKNAAKVSPAYTLWTDEYFVNMDVPPDAKVAVERGKKEERGKFSETVDFKDWVGRYNASESDTYMVQDLPAYLGKYVVLPPSLQCTSFIENAMVAQPIVWFSSGGTKSVVHTDTFHNLNCLYSGSKSFILVDPTLYKDKVPLDREEGSFSSLDVERVNFEKYPTLADVEYYNVTMEAGDCLFLPVLWIHQVNSFNRNLAVNVWFQRDAGDRTDLSTCLDEFDPSITLDKVPAQGLIRDEYLLEFITDMLIEYFKKYGKITFDQFERGLIFDHSGYLKEAGAGYKVPLKKLFRCVDKDVDDVITKEEYFETTEEGWKTFRQLFRNFREVLRDIFKNRPGLFNDVSGYPLEVGVILRDPSDKPATREHKTEL